MGGVIKGTFKVTRREAELFMIGLISGILQKDDLTILEKCVRASNNVMDDVSGIVDEMSEGVNITNITKAIQMIGDLSQTVPDELQRCPELSSDAQRIKSWGAVFDYSWYTVFSKVWKKVLSNIGSILSDMGIMISNMIKGQWEQAGLDFADILNLSLGILPPATENFYLY